MHTTNIIVAVDGNINTGKTTLIKELVKRHSVFSIREEYEYISEANICIRQKKYLLQDRKRTNLTNVKKIILDRSLFSLFGYVYWLYISNELDIRLEFYRLLINELNKKTVLLPNRLIVCCQEYENIYNSFLENKEIKGTEQFLASKKYIETQNSYYDKISEILGEKIIKYNYLFANNLENICEDKFEITTCEVLLAIQYAIGLKEIECKISINGISAVGKTSLCRYFSECGYDIINEVRMVNTTSDYSSVLKHQLSFFDKSLSRYSKKGHCIIDNGIIETISYTIFLAARKNYGLNFLKEYFSEINRKHYNIFFSQIIYLCIEKEELLKRKENDILKKRPHFEENSSFLKSELKLINFLEINLGKNVIVLVDANKDARQIFEECIERINFRSYPISYLLNTLQRHVEDIYLLYE